MVCPERDRKVHGTSTSPRCWEEAGEVEDGEALHRGEKRSLRLPAVPDLHHASRFCNCVRHTNCALPEEELGALKSGTTWLIADEFPDLIICWKHDILLKAQWSERSTVLHNRKKGMWIKEARAEGRSYVAEQLACPGYHRLPYIQFAYRFC